MRRSTKLGIVLALVMTSVGGESAAASSAKNATTVTSSRVITCKNYYDYLVLTTEVFCYGGFGFGCVKCDGLN